MNHLILGAGPAAIAAAKTIQKQKPNDKILILSADEHIHSRCMLHHFISGARSLQSLNFASHSLLSSENITLRLSTRAEKIDTVQKLVTTDKGEHFPYDALLIATGATSLIPPVGALRSAPNVYGLRDLCDAKAIQTAALGKQNIAVIGSGLVGLDAASALLELGKQVTIIEMAPHLLPLQLDEAAAASYQALFEAHGATFKLGRRVEDTLCDPSGRITTLVLDDGGQVPADLIIAATGVRPATALAEACGIATDRGITVDDRMRTSAPGIHAAGDATGLSGIWPNAVHMGEVAGSNMCGVPLTYSDRFAAKNTVNFFGLQTLCVGTPHAAPGDEVVLQQDRRGYKKAVLRGGKLQGVLLQGDIANAGFWQALIKNQLDLSGLKKPLFSLSYADFYATGPKGVYEYKL